MFQTFISRHNSNFFSDKLVLTSVTPAFSAPVFQTPKATSSTLYFDRLTVIAGNGGFLHCIQMDTSVDAANQVVSGGAVIAFDADPKFFACLVVVVVLQSLERVVRGSIGQHEDLLDVGGLKDLLIEVHREGETLRLRQRLQEEGSHDSFAGNGIPPQELVGSLEPRSRPSVGVAISELGLPGHAQSSILEQGRE